MELCPLSDYCNLHVTKTKQNIIKYESYWCRGESLKVNGVWLDRLGRLLVELDSEPVYFEMVPDLLPVQLRLGAVRVLPNHQQVHPQNQGRSSARREIQRVQKERHRKDLEEVAQCDLPVASDCSQGSGLLPALGNHAHGLLSCQALGWNQENQGLGQVEFQGHEGMPGCGS